MRKRVLSTVGIAAFCAVLATTVIPAGAADKPKDAPKTADAAKKEPAIPKKLSLLDMGTDLKTVDDYSMMLQKAGYTVKKGETASKQPALSISWKNGDWNYVIDLTLNKIEGQDYLSLISPLSNIPDMNQVPVASVVNLLQVQDATQGWYFVLNSKNKRFYICRLVPGAKINTAVLLHELKAYESNVQGTMRWWNPAVWQAAATAPAAQNQQAAPAPATK